MTRPSWRLRSPSSRRSDRARLRRPLRWLGALLLVAGLLVAARWRPQEPGDWGVVERFGFDAAECAARLATRQSAPFTLPVSYGEAVPVGEVARWFHLEASAVCAANEVAAVDCAAATLAPGEGLVLPLAREAEEGP